MPEEDLPYCDVSLAVPVDRAFTYQLPPTLRHRVQRGCRVLAPLGSRRMTGIVLRKHAEAPEVETRPVLALLDEEPALNEELLRLGEWIAKYYCAPLGEVYRAMTPLAAEVRQGKVYTLTDAGRDAVRQLALGTAVEDPAVALLGLLANRPLSAAYLGKKVPQAAKLLRSLRRRGFVEEEDVVEQRDPLRAPASKLAAQFLRRPSGERLRKAERELLAYLELHPGEHNLAAIEESIRGAATAARRLARAGMVALRPAGAGSGVGSLCSAPEPLRLSPGQEAALAAIQEPLRLKQFRVFLLQGVTGSGKTEVYLRAIEAALAEGRSALLMVPEIALTPAVSAQFYQRFGACVAILHSAFSGSERAGQWRAIREGRARVIVGTRSAVFAPVQNLGLIVVDEEHDQSYKQEETPRYHGRDVAVVRAQAASACVVLGSATPSLESRYNAQRGKYKLIELPERIGGRPLPEVTVIDMRQEFLETRQQATFSRALLEAIKERLAAGEQVMVLLNRRGFSSFVACRSCGARIECRHCAVTLTYHHRDRRMLCHYCNYAERAPRLCPRCMSEYLWFGGVGAEKVEEELHLYFPRARIARMDRDTVSGKRRYETILQAFRAHEYDILVGTQMIAKGHDIPNVTLVGVVSADVGLAMPDFRAAERTFQLLTQVAGRAGRGHLPGQVLIQTINPDHYAIRFAAAQNYQAFYEKELEFRRMMRYPPFSALANIMVRHASQEEAMRMAGEIGAFFGPLEREVKILGPAEAPIPRLKSEYRYQLLLKAVSRRRLNELLASLRAWAEQKRWAAASLVIDVDPISLL